MPNSGVKLLEILVEELSMEVSLRIIMPQIAPGLPFEIRRFSGKPDLLRNLPNRLKGYSAWAHAANLGIVVLVDRDDDDCVKLRAKLDAITVREGFSCASVTGDAFGTMLNRIAIEELEAWFFGDVEALGMAYPGVPGTLASKQRYRDPDAIKGGTWEALQRVLQAAGHHKGGLRKVAAAAEISRYLDVENNASSSFAGFRDGVRLLANGRDHA